MKKVLALALMILAFNASAEVEDRVVKKLETETILYAGTAVDVVSYIDLDIRNMAIRACGSESKIVGLSGYKLEIDLRGHSRYTLDLDLKKDNYTGALVYSSSYPVGKASFEVVCSK